jgi:hypothetical protein
MSTIIQEASQREKDHQATLNQINDEQVIVTKTPWLRRTGWSRMFKEKDMVKLNELTAKPTMKEHDLFTVWTSVRRLIKTCFEGVLDCENRGWTLIPFWLASSNSTMAATIPFRTYFPEATIDRYASYW